MRRTQLSCCSVRASNHFRLVLKLLVAMPSVVASFSGTLTNGIQEVSALLPIIGTEQCEKHIGSALEGGYIYAAATPLSIFGSLGIVKNGISILVASISIPKPSTRHGFLLHDRLNQRWLGARVLANAGFAPVGTVAPLIGIVKKRYKAETRLIEILEEKRIDASENISIQWKSHQWNTSLILCTLLAAALGMAPYAHLIPKATIPSPWIFPMFRVLGSCLATISIQFLIQYRVVSLTKSRIIFMAMNRLHSNDLTTILEQFNLNFQWDEDLPAEECLTSLGQCLGVYRDTVKHVSHSLATTITRVRENLHTQNAMHFPNPTRQHFFTIFFWTILLISLPATVVGYVGCFTLVSSSGEASAPVIWLGVEAALAVLRILLWAWNPKFDEDTEVTVQLKLSDHPPLVTTDKDADLIRLTDGVLSLTPERTFLEWISPYTGPLKPFDSPPNIVLYYTLTGVQVESSLTRLPVEEWRRNRTLYLFMTVLDSSNRTAFSVTHREDNYLVYHDAAVVQNSDTGETQANLRST